jgi:hypothetical protein
MTNLTSYTTKASVQRIEAFLLRQAWGGQNKADRRDKTYGTYETYREGAIIPIIPKQQKKGRSEERPFLVMSYQELDDETSSRLAQCPKPQHTLRM